jgi:soluble cytochrome b562
MKRNDYKQLASAIGALLRSGELTRSGADYFISQLDNASASFNRGAFEDAAGIKDYAHG